MGRWIYADCSGRYEGIEAIQLAVAAEGKRNIFHEDALLQLESRERHLHCPPLTRERRLCLSIMPNGWPYLVVEELSAWLSEPILLVAEQPAWVRRRALNEAVTTAVAMALFDRVHRELHARARYARSASLPDAALVARVTA